MTNKLESHFEIVGRVIRWLANNGLSRCDIHSRNALKVLGYENDKEAPEENEIADVLEWLLDEGLIRLPLQRGPYNTIGGRFAYMGIQLTSRAINILQKPIDDSTQAANLGQELSKPEGELAPSAYAKIGALIGGIVGGAAKTLS